MRGCLTLLVLLGTALVAIAMIGSSFLYCVALAIVWLVLVGFSKVFGTQEKEEEDESKESV